MKISVKQRRMFSTVRMRVLLKACIFELHRQSYVRMYALLLLSNLNNNSTKTIKRYLVLVQCISDIVSTLVVDWAHHVLNGILMSSSLLQVYSLAWTASGFTSLGRSTFSSSLPSTFNTTSSCIIIM